MIPGQCAPRLLSDYRRAPHWSKSHIGDGCSNAGDDRTHIEPAVAVVVAVLFDVPTNDSVAAEIVAPAVRADVRNRTNPRLIL